MKLVKNIAVLSVAASLMFAGVSFHSANNYTELDGGTSVKGSFGVNYDLNENTSIGWDSELGLMMMFDAPAGVSLRLGWTAGNADSCVDQAGVAVGGIGTDADCAADDTGGFGAGTNVWTDGNPAGTSIGLGYTWWSGGSSYKTSISTNFDYMMRPHDAADFEEAWDENSTNLSVVVGFGF